MIRRESVIISVASLAILLWSGDLRAQPDDSVAVTTAFQWMNSVASRPSKSGPYLLWLLESEYFNGPVTGRFFQGDADVHLTSPPRLERVWHVRVLPDRESTYRSPVLPERESAYRSKELLDLLFDNDGTLIGYFFGYGDWRAFPRTMTSRSVTSHEAEPWSRAHIYSEETPLAGLLIRMRNLEFLMSQVLWQPFRAVDSDELPRIAFAIRYSLSHEFLYAEDRMTVVNFELVRTTDTTVESLPVVMLVDQAGRVEFASVGTEGVQIKPAKHSHAEPHSTRGPAEIEKKIRIDLRGIDDKIDSAVQGLPSIERDGRKYYLAEAASQFDKELRNQILSAVGDAPALHDTIAQLLDAERLSTTRVLLENRDTYVLIATAPTLEVVTLEEIKVVVDRAHRRLRQLLALKTLRPDVQCRSFPSHAHIEIRVGDSEASRRFTDTDTPLTELWRGIYKGSATVMAGGYKPATVDLDIYNQVSAGIRCQFEPLGSSKNSFCSQTTE